MANRTPNRHNTLLKISALISASAALAACATTTNETLSAGKEAEYRDAIGAYTAKGPNGEDLDPVAAAAFWGTRYERDPKNAEAAVNYSQALRKIGSIEEAVKVATAAANRIDNDPHVKLEAGKALIEGGRAFEAVRFLEEAAGELPNDWSALSAYGVALDQIGEHALAQAKYDEALAHAPGSPLLMNNKGLSFALAGDLDRAARVLRKATAATGADARVRQNLALVLALKGDLREAERLARSDLPPQIADRNIDYFRTLMNQPSYWQDYAEGDFETPVFDAPPAAPAPAAPSDAPSQAPAPLKQPEAEEPDQSEPMASTGAVPVTTTSADEDSAPTPLIKE